MVMEQHDSTEWPFYFTHLVPSEEMDNRVRALEVQGGSPGLDRFYLFAHAEEAVLEELRGRARALNLRDHQIEHDWDCLGVDAMVIHCLFKHDSDMVTFKTFLT